jgi:hypothetical protein
MTCSIQPDIIAWLESKACRDFAEIRRPGTLVTDVDQSQIQQNLAPEVQYACLHWIQHVQKSGVQLQDDDFVHQIAWECP